MIRNSILTFLVLAVAMGDNTAALAQLPIGAMQAPPDEHSICGFTSALMLERNTSTERETSGTQQALFPPALVVQCGYYRLYFEDQVAGAGLGFDAGGGVGATRRATACAVFTYLSSLITAPPPGQFIDIHFRASTPILPPPLPLAVGYPFLPPPTPGSIWDNGGLPFGGIATGYAFDHLTSGVDPDPNEYDGHIQVDFTTYSFVGDPATNLNACNQYDLFTVILHEAVHVLGWFSMIIESGGNSMSQNQLSPPPFNAPVFSHYDNTFLFHGDIFTGGVGGPFTKLLNVSNLSPFTYTLLNTPQCLHDGRVWMYGEGVGNHDLPVMTGISQTWSLDSWHYAPSYTNVYNPANLTHLDRSTSSFNLKSHMAPGFNPPYVMNFGLDVRGQRRVELTRQEIRVLQDLGYSLDPGYLSTSGLNSNTPPYTDRLTGEPSFTNVFGLWTETAPADFVIANNCEVLNINLSTRPELHDDEGNPIRVAPGSLFNIRGCGNGGNDHNQLSLTSTPGGDVISFTPRADFVGRVQFAFHLWDEHERGDFMY